MKRRNITYYTSVNQMKKNTVYIRAGSIMEMLFVADSEEEAWGFCDQCNWEWYDENNFCWHLNYVE